MNVLIIENREILNSQLTEETILHTTQTYFYILNNLYFINYSITVIYCMSVNFEQHHFQKKKLKKKILSMHKETNALKYIYVHIL